MNFAFALGFIAWSCLPSFARPPGETAMAPYTDFPGAFTASVRLALRESSELYPGQFLFAFRDHLRAVAGMTNAQAVSGYLCEQASYEGSCGALKTRLGLMPIDARRAAAVFLANALFAPEQFETVTDGLEALSHGIGFEAVSMMRDTRGAGDKKIIKLLRQRGQRKPHSVRSRYERFEGPNPGFDFASRPAPSAQSLPAQGADRALRPAN